MAGIRWDSDKNNVAALKSIVTPEDGAQETSQSDPAGRQGSVFLCDTSNFDAARRKLMSLVGEVVPPDKFAKIVREILLDAFSSLDNAVAYRSKVSTTKRTVKQVLFLEPSELMLELLAAFRTKNWDQLVKRHGRL